MENIVKILDIQQVTHDVKCFKIEKPQGYTFTPGQATDVSINQKEWAEEKRPFTFTCLNADDYLEFTIKRYEDHHGVTDKLHHLKVGDELIIGDVWGAIEYQGPGYFIAGGAGITPFISILRQLNQDGKINGNILFFSNNTAADVIYENELRKILDRNVDFILTKEENSNYTKAFIDEGFIKQHVEDLHKHFYLCGPDKMVEDIRKILADLGAKTDTVVFEK